MPSWPWRLVIAAVYATGAYVVPLIYRRAVVTARGAIPESGPVTVLINVQAALFGIFWPVCWPAMVITWISGHIARALASRLGLHEWPQPPRIVARIPSAEAREFRIEHSCSTCRGPILPEGSIAQCPECKGHLPAFVLEERLAGAGCCSTCGVAAEFKLTKVCEECGLPRSERSEYGEAKNSKETKEAIH